MKNDSAPTTRRLAVCVDDIGLHDGVDQAALALFAQGRINTVSALTEGLSWPRVLPRLREQPADELDVGLHFNLTETVGTHPALSGLGGVIARAYAHLLSPAELRDRFERQLDAFETGLGRAPSHVDGHQHIHQLPQVRDVILQALSTRYGHLPTAQRPWLRSCRTRAPVSAGTPATAPTPTSTDLQRISAAARKARIIHALGATAFHARSHAGGWRTNGVLLGVYDLRDTATQYLILLNAWLNAAQDGDLLMCHPGLATIGDTLSATRQSEYDWLASPIVGELLTQQQVTLVPMSRILRVAA